MLIGVVSRTVILLEECVLYLEESVLHCSFPSPGNGAHMRKLFEVLNAGVLFESVKRRSADLRKNVKGASVELVSVQKMLSLTSKIQQAKMYEVLQVGRLDCDSQTNSPDNNLNPATRVQIARCLC